MKIFVSKKCEIFYLWYMRVWVFTHFTYRFPLFCILRSECRFSHILIMEMYLYPIGKSLCSFSWLINIEFPLYKNLGALFHIYETKNILYITYESVHPYFKIYGIESFLCVIYDMQSPLSHLKIWEQIFKYRIHTVYSLLYTRIRVWTII